MAKFLVPNTPDAAQIDIAEPDAGDFLALGNRATGILTGGDITALGTPGMSVSVGAVTCIIDGVPYSYTGVTKSINPPGGTARFDLVGWDTSGPAVITGTSTTNARFPDYDPLTFALGAVVYVSAGAAAITAQYVISKGPTMEPSFRRKYSADTDVFLAADAPAGIFTVNANGKHQWGSNILQKVSDSIMEWTSSIKIKAADTANSVLTLTGRATNPNTHAVLDIRNSGGTQVGYWDAEGRIGSLNFQRGSGSPEGNRPGAVGDMYMNTAATDGNILYVKTTSTGTSGWLVHRAYDASIGAVPVGTLIPWTGQVGVGIPAGYVKALGQGLNTTTNAALFAITGYRFGGSGSTFVVPNLQGRTVFGDGGTLAFDMGTYQGAAGATVQLSITHIPTHNHVVIDTGHGHPQAGPYWYYVPSAFHNNRHPTPSSSLSLEHLYVDWDTTRLGATGITLQNTGDGTAFSIMPPAVVVQWLIKT